MAGQKENKKLIKQLSEAMAKTPLTVPRLKVFNEVNEERVQQDKKFGVQNHPSEIWLAILGEEVGECNNAFLEMKFGCGMTIDDLRTELIQVAAVAVSFVECIDRNSKTTKQREIFSGLTGNKNATA